MNANQHRLPAIVLSVTIAAFAHSAQSGQPGDLAPASQAHLAITPPVVTNNYSGTITLAIGGVPPGATVAVEKYLDVNDNGQIDDQDLVVQGFTLTDGQLPIIGGVRNLNVPGDEDALADGHLRAEVRFPGVEPISGGMSGRFLFRVRGVDVAIEPATNRFEVRQAVLAQGVSGRVTEAASGLPLARAIVVLARQYGWAGTMGLSDTNGDFTLYGEPGDYQLAATRKDYVGRLNNLTLSASQLTHLDLPMSPGILTVAGRLYDAGSGVGVAGILMTAENEEGWFSFGFTDEAGRYETRLFPGRWALPIERPSLAGQGYVGYDEAFETNLITSVTNLDLVVFKANALIYGRIVDDRGHPMERVLIAAGDTNQVFQTDALSYAPQGDYALGVLVGSYETGFDEEELARRGYVGPRIQANALAGQAVRLDPVLRSVTADLTVFVHDTANRPITNLQFWASISVGGTNYFSDGETGIDGRYPMAAFDGTWTIGLECDDDDPSDPGLWQRGYECVDPRNVTVAGGPQTVDFTVSLRSNVAFVAFTNASYTVSEAGPSVSINVVRSGELTTTARVDYVTVNRSAVSPSDYGGTNGTLTFRPGVTFRTITIPVVNDTIAETNKSFEVHLLNPTNGVELGTFALVVVTIVDNDLAQISFGSATYAVGEGQTNALISLKRAKNLASEVGVTVCTSNGTAEAGSDYLSVCTNILFKANQTNKTLKVPILNDCAHESDETVLLFLSNPTGGARLGANSNAVLTILDDDSAGVIQFSTNDYRVTENGGQAAIVVRRTGGAACNASVDLLVTNGTATAGEDFEAMVTNLVFAAGQRRLTSMVTILDDLLPEGDETVSLSLRNPKGGAVLGSISNASLTIQDDESTVAFTNANYTVGEAGASISLNVIRSGALTTTVRVDYVTVDRSAVSPSDYVGTNGTLTFRPGKTFRTITIPIANDTIDETNESFEVRLLNPRDGVELGTLTQAVVTILDDDAGGVISFSAASYTVGEGQTNALITLKRTKGLAGDVWVTVCTSNGTAEAGSDYLRMCTNILFKANQANKTVKVPIVNDSVEEGNETVLLFLSGPSGGATLGSLSNALLTIIDDDSPVERIYKGDGSTSKTSCADPREDWSGSLEGEFDVTTKSGGTLVATGALIVGYGPSTPVSVSGTVDGAGKISGNYISDISAGSFSGTLSSSRLRFVVDRQPTTIGCLASITLDVPVYQPPSGGFAPASVRGFEFELTAKSVTGYLTNYLRANGRYPLKFDPIGYRYRLTDSLGSPITSGIYLFTKTRPDSGSITTSDMELPAGTTGSLTWTSASGGSFSLQGIIDGFGTLNGAFTTMRGNANAAVQIRPVVSDSSGGLLPSGAAVFTGVDPKLDSAAGVPLMLSPTRGTPSGVEVCWTSVFGRCYSLERATNLSAPLVFVLLQRDIPGQTNTTCHTDSTATNAGPYFYRVRIER